MPSRIHYVFMMSPVALPTSASPIQQIKILYIFKFLVLNENVQKVTFQRQDFVKLNSFKR